MSNCTFCNLIQSDGFKFRTIYEDDEFIAFIDQSQLVTGHTQIITRQHYHWVWDYPDPGKYFATAQKIVEHFKSVLNIEKVDLLVSGGSESHAHIHILPNTQGLWFEVMDYLREQRKKLTEEQKHIDPQLVQKLKIGDNSELADSSNNRT